MSEYDKLEEAIRDSAVTGALSKIPDKFVEFTKEVDPLPFGKAIKEAWFSHLQPYYLAHGSYGAPSSLALEEGEEWTKLTEINPAHFYYHLLYQQLALSTISLATFLKVPPSSLFLVKNVEQGIQSCLHSLVTSLKKGSSIVSFDLGYGAVNIALDRFCKQQQEAGRDLTYVQVKISFPLTRESVLKNLSSFLQNSQASHKEVSIVVLEHIASPTGIVMPLKEMIVLCKKYYPNCITIVDGAHAIGAIHFNLEDLQCDYYTSNLHKWMCSKRGVAFLYQCKNREETSLRPLLTSWGEAYKGSHSKFVWQGTDDYSPYLSIPTLIRFYEWAPWIERNTSLARWTGGMLSEVWSTNTLVDNEMTASMVSVLLPPVLLASKASALDCFMAMKKEFKVEAPTFLIEGQRYVRVSCHIYNDALDCLHLASSVLKSFGYPLSHPAFKILKEYSPVSSKL